MDQPAAPTPCAMCQSTPSQVISIRRHVGMILMQKFYKLRQPLCRDCGLRLTKGWTGKTLLQGWWGYISCFFNIFVVLANLVALVRFSRMPHPIRPLGTRSPVEAH